MENPLFTLQKPIRPIFVYGLCAPDTNELRYIGLTCNGFQRIKNHYNDSFLDYKHSAIKKWVKHLRLQNKIFNVIYIEYFNKDGLHVDEAEKFWIEYFRSIGARLLNHEKGGRVYGDLHHYKDSKSKALKGRKKSPQHAENIKKGKVREYGVKLKDDRGNVFNSLQEAADFYNTSKSNIQKAAYGQISSYKGIKFTKLGGGMKPDSEIKVNKWVKKGRKPVINRIIDNNGIIYQNAKECAKLLNISYTTVFRFLNKTNKNSKLNISLEYYKE